MINGCSLEKPCLLASEIYWDLSCNAYIRLITNDAGEMVGSSYRFSKYLTPPDLLYIYK